MLSIIIPTYQERQNIAPLCKEIFDVLDVAGIAFEILIVDDNSPDGTAEEAKKLIEQYPIRVIVRTTNRGLGAAVRRGFKEARGDVLAVMDADLSHDPNLLPRMFSAIQSGTDIVIGTRFSEESQVEGWTIWRKCTSVFGVWMAKKITGVSDPLSGFFMFKNILIQQIHLDTVGYKILFEILVKVPHSTVKEFSYIFRMRKFSESKLNIKEYARFFMQVLRYSVYKIFFNR